MEEKNIELKPKIIRESEFFGGCIRVKISVKNNSSPAIMDAALELESDDRILHFDRCKPEYPEKKGKILLGNLDPNTDRTIALYLDPLIFAKEGTNVNCRVFYKDAYGNSDMVQMEPLKIKVICPIFRTEQDINIGRLKELVSRLSFHDSKVYTIPKRVEPAELLGKCRDVVLLHDVRHIKDSIIQRSNLLSFCDLDGTCVGDVVIEDSVVQRANIGLGNEVQMSKMSRLQKQTKWNRNSMICL